MSKNKNLHKAKKEANNEFYTQLSDIEQELQHYKDHFKDKIVYCNCDDHRQSNFFKYFSLNFEYLGLKKLITTHFNDSGIAYKFEIFRDQNGDGKINHLDTIETPLKQNGDFRSDEAVELLKECDIVVSNPPFSLFREYIDLIFEYDKKFLILGNNNAITYKNVFGYIKNNELWLGVNSNKTMEFKLREDYTKWDRVDGEGNKYGKVPAISWFTNLEHKKRNEKLILYKEYTPEEYPNYDNYDAIEVSKTNEIPINYDGVMGVPISFLSKHCPEQFEIVSCNDYRKNDKTPYKEHGLIKDKDSAIDGKPVYVRILIKHKNTKNADTTQTN